MSRNIRTLEINIISAEALLVNPKQLVKKSAFVILSTDDSRVTGVTNIDAEGGSYSAWDQKFVMEIPMYAKYFTLEVKCKGFSGDQIIGSANVPVSDFTAEYFPRNYVHFLSYRLRDRKGERNGIINISVRVKSMDDDDGTSVANYSSSWMMAPVDGKVAHHQGVAMGIPVW